MTIWPVISQTVIVNAQLGNTYYDKKVGASQEVQERHCPHEQEESATIEWSVLGKHREV